MKNILILTLSGILIFLASCKKQEIEEPKAPGTMNELQVPDGFNWKTTTDTQLNLTASASGLAEVSGTDGTVYSKAFVFAGKAQMLKLTIPGFEKKITIRHNGKSVTLDLVPGSMAYDFE